jgi:hypothetical protein
MTPRYTFLLGCVATIALSGVPTTRGQETTDRAAAPATQPNAEQRRPNWERPVGPRRMGDGAGPLRDQGGVRGPFGLGGADRRMPPGPAVSEDPPSDGEWEQIVEFIRENSPSRFEIFSELLDRAETDNRHNAQSAIRRRAAIRYRMIRQVQDDQPELYPFALKQLQLEDKVIGAFRSLNKLQNDTPSQGERERLVAEIRVYANELVENRFAEREQRIRTLEQLIESERARLAQDREAREEFVERVEQRLSDESSRMGQLRRRGPGDAPPEPVGDRPR